MSFLDKNPFPEDVKALSAEKIPGLCNELRERIIDVTTKNGGHIASSLGAVELIVALLRSFNPGNDRILFDVGHQAYAWKLLTGRADRFDTLRTEKGINGFPRMDESVYDHFGVGHSSTSLSAALGYAVAGKLKKEKRHVVAVIGDGALINGEAFEALNHAGGLNIPVIFVLNDNAMSISPRVGGMAMHLARLSTSPVYRATKGAVKLACSHLPGGDKMYHVFERIKVNMKNMLLRGNLFNDMGLTYWGPFDGHDESRLEQVFSLAARYDGPLVIHIVTKKGKGYAPAESDPVHYHGISPSGGKKTSSLKWSVAAAECIEREAERDPRIVALTPAMAEGSGLAGFREKFPHRFFDVGIAEEHMMTFSAGLAAGGMKPVACIYSTFLQRAVDQLVHDICLQHLPVVLAIDRAGLVGADGETHQGLFDMNWLSVIPGLSVWSPYDHSSLEAAFSAAFRDKGPCAVRYPRGTVPEISMDGFDVTPERAVLSKGARTCVVAIGSAVIPALSARELAAVKEREIPDLIFLNRVSPLPSDLQELLCAYDRAVVVEEAYQRGGIGEHIASCCAEAGASVRVIPLGLPASWVAPASPERQRALLGLTAERIVDYCGKM